MSKLIRLCLLFTLFSLTSCMTSRLVVQTRYFSDENLASFYVDTPDPLQNNPPIGQNLLMFWNLKKDFCKYENIELKYTIRFRNKKEITEAVRLTKRKGYYIYSILNCDYFDSGGIQTYKVELLGDGIVFEEWRQHLWKELIVF